MNFSSAFGSSAFVSGCSSRASRRNAFLISVSPALRSLSLVAANYGLPQRNLGTVSVVGPTRMDYRLAITTVREAAHQLSRFIEDVYEEG